MKTYEEMLDFAVDQIESGNFQYQKWVVGQTLAHMFGLENEVVYRDIDCFLAIREDKRKIERMKQRQVENAGRRNANAKKAFEQGKEAALNGYERVSPYTKIASEKDWYSGFDSVK